VNDSFNAGTHNVVWNGKDDNGNSVGSGMYFYKMQAGEHTDVRRMLMLK
jgi:flagellar hook assembly protein FlgD